MDIALYVVAGLLMLVGIVGCIVPGLPGPPLSYIGLVLLKFTPLGADIGWLEIVITGLVVVAATVLDYLTPVIGTKKFGGGKYGNWGCIAGTIVGLFFPPWGIFVGPFIGAVIGELIAKKPFAAALKAGFGAFLGFFVSLLLKLAICLYLITRFVVAFF